MGKAWTAGAMLPGGDLAGADFPAFPSALRIDGPWLPADLAEHHAPPYGTRALLGHAGTLDALGRHHGSLLHEREGAFLRDTEWAGRPSDTLSYGIRSITSGRPEAGRYRSGQADVASRVRPMRLTRHRRR